MVRSMENSYGDAVGYTDDMFELTIDLRIHTRFIASLVRLKTLTIREGQVINSNFGYQQFQKLREDGESSAV